MKRAAVAIRSLTAFIAAGIGREGAFLIGGTIALAVGSTFLSPAGPWIVVGSVCLLAWYALAVPRSH